ncbi:hypothetical protein ACE2AJ_16470 [Aquihabitans daechungensis]|uniref:hypothetical protein n=1 Tax=Aquihabitans daechungensis TaxID=1052257 RepID=UPI003B9F2114
MKQIRDRRSLAVLLAVLVSASAATLTTGCDPVSRDWAWKAGKTHGAIIETTAGRASVGIYRVPTELLYVAQQRQGVGAVQGALWKFGRPPELRRTFTFRGRSVTLRFGAGTRALRSLTYHLIYDDPGDLRAAVTDAHRSRSCLAITVLSYGRPTRNWTKKQVGCQNGSI